MEDNEEKYSTKYCGVVEQTSSLVIDHNHDTGAVRGLLCNPCNRGLGFFRDSSAALSRAAFYIEEDGIYAE